MLKVKVKVYRDKIMKGLEFYLIHHKGEVSFKTANMGGEAILDINMGTHKSNKFINRHLDFKCVKYLNAGDLVELTKNPAFREWAGDKLDQAGFNY